MKSSKYRCAAVLQVFLLAATMARGVGAAPTSDDLTITYVGNAGYLLESGGRKVLIDALVADYDSQYVQLSEEHQQRLETAQPPFDGVELVLATHYHHDHFGAQSVGRYLVANRQAQFVSTPQAVHKLTLEFPGFRDIASRVTTAAPKEGAAQSVAGLGLEALNLHHGRYRRPLVENLGLIFEVGKWRLLHVGDTEITPAEFQDSEDSLGRIDVAMITTWFLMDRGWESIEQWRSVIESVVNPSHVVLIHLAPGWRTDNSEASSRQWVEGIQARYPETLILSEAMESRRLESKSLQLNPVGRPSFRFARKGETIALEPELEDQIAAQVETVYGTCALNSRRSGHSKPREDLQKLWDRILIDSFIHLEYAEPVSFRPGIEVTEILQELPEGNFAGHLLTRGSGEYIAYGKCDGLETLRLMCLDTFAEHLPAGYQSSCEIVERVDGERVELQTSP